MGGTANAALGFNTTVVNGTPFLVSLDSTHAGATVTDAIIEFCPAQFSTFGSGRGTVTIDVTVKIKLDGSYETIKLIGNLEADTTITVPSEDGWSARFLDLTTRNDHALKVNAGVLPGMADLALRNGQTQRLYIVYLASVPEYNIRPEGPPA